MALAVVNPIDVPQTTANWFHIKVGDDVYNPQWARKPYSITSKDNDTLRFELRDGEQHWWDAAVGHNSERVEIAGDKLYKNSDPIHISYGFKLEEGAPNTAKWMVLGQLHTGTWEGESGVSPPFRIVLEGEKMAIYIGRTSTDGYNVGKLVYSDVYDIERGHQYQMDVKILFDAAGNGRLVVTRDNVVIVDYKGELGYKLQQDVYWAEGIYRDSAATETVVAEYSHLQVTSGPSVTFPTGDVYIAAPKLTIASVGNAAADGSRIAHVTGTAKPNSSVTITDGTNVLGVAKVDAQGNISYDLKIPKASELFLHATATDAGGAKGNPAVPLSIEVGTAADIASRLVQIAQQGNVGAVVITDSTVLKIPGGQIYYLLSKAGAALEKIQGPYSFLETYAVNGKGYDRQDVAYTSTGVITERLRYSDNKLVYDEKIATDGSREVFTYTATGGEDRAFYSKDGQLTRLEKYEAGHKPSFLQINHANGAVETYTYNAVSGLPATHIIVNADKSRIAEQLNLTGQAYSKQTFTFDKSGTLVGQDRFDADGTKIWSQFTNPDGSKEFHTYNADTGKDLTYTITKADGTRVEGKFEVTGKAYAGIVTYWTAANKLVGTDTYDAKGKLLESDRWNSDGSHTVYTIDKATGQATGFKLYLANGSVTETVYPVVKPQPPVVVTPTNPLESVGADGTRTISVVDANGQKTGYTVITKDGATTNVVYHAGTTAVEKRENFDATGRFTGVDRYDKQGHLVSSEVRKADGTMESHQYNAAGKEISYAMLNADGTRTYATVNIEGKAYDLQKVVYDASNKLLEMTRWADGKLLMSQSTRPDGTEHVVNVAANGSKTDTISVAGKVVKVETFDTGGHLTLSDVRNADGSRELHRFDPVSGRETGYTTTAADKSRYEMAYGIQNKPYDQQLVHFDKNGTLIELSRWADGHLQFTQTVNAWGTEVRSYDIAGRTTLQQNLFTDGSREVHSFEFATPATSSPGIRLAAATPDDPIRVQIDHYGANGARTYTDIQNANGTHDQIAHASGVKLTSHAGIKDVFTSAGNDRFVFDQGLGNDVIKKFVTAGAAHDVIQIDQDLAHAFSDLVIQDSGADTIITFTPTDSITLTNVKASQLTQEHFLFV